MNTLKINGETFEFSEDDCCIIVGNKVRVVPSGTATFSSGRNVVSGDDCSINVYGGFVGRAVSGSGNVVCIGGTEQTTVDEAAPGRRCLVEILPGGHPLTVHSYGSVRVEGDVGGDVDAVGGVSVTGGVKGKVETTGRVEVGGDVGGKVETTGAVTVKGSVLKGVDTTGAVTVNGDVHGKVDTTGRVVVGGVIHGKKKEK